MIRIIIIKLYIRGYRLLDCETTTAVFVDCVASALFVLIHDCKPVNVNTTVDLPPRYRTHRGLSRLFYGQF